MKDPGSNEGEGLRPDERRPRLVPLPSPSETGIAIWHQACDRSPVQLHAHGFFEIIYVERGTVHHQVEGVNRPLRAGELDVLAPGATHVLLPSPDAEKWVIGFSLEALGPADVGDASSEAEEFLFRLFVNRDSGRFHRFTVPLETRAHLQSLLRALTHELRERPIGFATAARALLQLILIWGAVRLEKPPHQAMVRPAIHPAVLAAFRFIEKRFRSPIGLVDVARAVGLSPAYLTSMVREQTGQTVLRWITEWRMREARRLLLETEESVAEIGHLVGYDDASHFIRQFRRAFRLTPQIWRRVYRRPGRAKPGQRERGVDREPPSSTPS